MLGLSFIRFIGILLGLICLLLAFLKLRKHANHRIDVWLLVSIGLFLFIIGTFPSVVNYPSYKLSLDMPGGRIVTILIFSSVLLWFLIIYERGKRISIEIQFDKVIRRIIVNNFINKCNEELTENTILIIIPAYNEEKNLNNILPKMPSQINNKPVKVLVIDDGSKDGTEMVAKNNGAIVLKHPTNLGGGTAIRTGFEIALSFGVYIVVTMDGDGQHNPEDIAKLICPIIDKEADIVIGSRILGSFELNSVFRWTGIIFFSRLISILMGKKITDCSSGFRALLVSKVDSVYLVQKQYHTAELIIGAIKRGLVIAERPIHISKRISGKSKKGADLLYALRFLRTVMTTWWR